MLSKEKLYKESVERVGTSLSGLSKLITNSFECETYSSKPVHEVKEQLSRLDGGTIPIEMKNDGVNMGNGWNADCHQDGTVNSYDSLRDYYDIEVSSAPLKATNFDELREELERMYGTLSKATTLKHSVMASSHVHTTVRYADTGSFNGYEAIVKLPHKQIIVNIGKFMLKFMPLLKWLSMTSSSGARGSKTMTTSHGSNRVNPYDKLENDSLFYWHDTYNDHNLLGVQFNHMRFGRDSYFRVFDQGDSSGVVHWENRMMDATASHTHMAMWIAINKAITLWAIDMAMKEVPFEVSGYDKTKSLTEMNNHRQGFIHVNKDFIEQQSKEMVGYLAKYLYVSHNIDAVKYIEKLVKIPIPAYLQSKGIDVHYNPFEIEKAFNERKAKKNDELRQKYLRALDAMVVPVADTLTDFHENCAAFLGVEFKQVKSLYQMMMRENVDLKWLGNRLVNMTDLLIRK